ncbi:MAG: thioesterase family protein [Rhizobiaceae bacterium]
MYTWFRFIHMLAAAKSRGPFRAGDASRFSFRCLPSDIDFNGHMNNARYLALADIGRIDIFARTGMLKLRHERGWAPMMGGVQAVYLREIRLWKKFEVITTIETWDGNQVIGRHRFVFQDGTTAAILMTTAGIYDLRNRRFIPFDEVMRATGIFGERRAPTEAERAFMASHAAIRATGKAENGH